jgi:hypothetical protein
MMKPLFKAGAMRVPNQEKVAKRDARVTYHDNCKSMRVILLPNWEIMQAHSGRAASKSLCLHIEAGLGMVRDLKRESLQNWHPGNVCRDFNFPGWQF